MFISNAYAQAAAPAGAAGGLMSFLPIILMFVVLYFRMIRPQMKRQKEQKAMIDALGKGDEVITAGGLVGKVTKVGDAYLTLEVAQGTEIVLQRASVTMLLPKGTIKATVLIETILASFETDEILHELRDHSAGLNCGRCDYFFSFIKKFRRDPAAVLPDRGLVTMTTPFLRKCWQAFSPR